MKGLASQPSTTSAPNSAFRFSQLAGLAGSPPISTLMAYRQMPGR